MNEAAARALLIVAAIGVVVATPLVARMRAAAAASRAPLDLSGLTGSILFFSDAACRRCERVRAMLERWAPSFVEIRHDTDRDAHQRAGVDAVPLVVVRDRHGAVVARFAGVPSARHLRRAIAR
jgi:glutaredoxin